MVQQAEAHLQHRELISALACFDVAEAEGADADRCSAGRWLAQMLLGEFEAAWRESDLIRARGLPDPHRFWQGESLKGKRVILRCLHGFGDAVQMLRYVPALHAKAGSLVIEVPPALLDLATMFNGAGEVIAWGESAPAEPPQWDVQIEINELPYLFRTKANQLPIATRYLRLPQELLQRTSPRPYDDASLRIGMVWASGEWNPRRGVPFEVLRPVFNTFGCEFWNLQGGAARDHWNQLTTSPKLHDATTCADSILNLAALIAQLDLVITPDTLVAHLAGALGTPAFVMLEHAADWRWQHDREDSPWYPGLQLIRQTSDRDWRSVVAEVQRSLQTFTPHRLQQLATR